MTITTRAGKGSELTHNELDVNFTDLRDGVSMMLPKTQGVGIKVDSLGTPTFPWHDLHSTLHTDASTPATLPAFVTYRNGIKGRQFDVNDEAFIEFHLPHDYVMGSEIFIHAHWSQAATTVTGGSTSWTFELSYAKGHDQAAFSATKLITATQNANTTQYQHMVAETSMTAVTESATAFAVGIMEPDAVLMCRVYLSANNMTVSGGGVPAPFLHFVDLHYQSTNVGTKNRSPSFWG